MVKGGSNEQMLQIASYLIEKEHAAKAAN